MTGAQIQWVVPLELAGRITALALAGPADRVAVEAEGIRFDVPAGEAVYLAEGGRIPRSATPGAFAVAEGREHEVVARVRVTGTATLWIFAFDDAGQVLTARSRLRSGPYRLRFPAGSGIGAATLGLRLQGAGSLQLDGLKVVSHAGAPALPGAEEVLRLRAAAAARPLRPYDALTREDVWTPATPVLAAQAARGAWSSPPFPEVAITPPIAWGSLCAAHRTWDFRLHALDPVAGLLAQHSRDGEGRWLAPAVALAEDWLDGDPGPGGEPASPFAWYDMGVGLRTARLAYALDAMARDPAYDDVRVGRLARAVAEHCRWLAEPENFAGHSNHGVYQAAGLAAAVARLPELASVAALAPLGRGLLAEALAAQFSAEGVHLEHSPGYHLMLAQVLGHAADANLVDDDRLPALAARAREAVAWFVSPAGTVVTIGDSDADSPVLSGDVATVPPPGRRIAGWPEAGYVAMRDGSSHLVQICRHHSPVHVHDDLLAFVWHERGHDVLVDPGRFSYLYDDPRRRYVTSRRAHNTVELPWTAESSRLAGFGDLGDAVWSVTEARSASATHRRALVLAPDRWLVVIDAIEDADPAAPPPIQRFVAGPELAAGAWGEAGLRLVLPSGRVVWATPLLPAEPLGAVVGRMEPEPVGWSSPTQLEWRSAASFAFRAAAGAAPWVLAALFAWDDAPEALPGSAAPGGASLAWSARGTIWQVDIAGDGPPAVRSEAAG